MTISYFEKLNLSSEMMQGLRKMGFTVPTPVQQATIPPMLAGRDVMVQAPTGTGKTCAFGIPVIEGIQAQNRAIQTIILCPTRELAVQTATVMKKLAVYKPEIRVLAIYGGEPILRQVKALRQNPQIIVATPGRMLDHMRRRAIRLEQVSCVVLDEADRMLDMGFREDIDAILQGVSSAHQTVLFSATLSAGIKRIAAAYQRDVQHVHIQPDTRRARDQVKQYYTEIRGQAKTTALIALLRDKQFPLSLIFVATKAMADTLTQNLTRAGLLADALHGNLRQVQRDQVMARYRTGKVNVLVATDVAARGLDVHNISAVINYDIPGDSESYVHRIGRTGRADQHGLAYTFIDPRERGKLRAIISDTKAAIQPLHLNGATPVDLMPEPAKPRTNTGKDWNRSYGKKRYGRSRQGMGGNGLKAQA